MSKPKNKGIARAARERRKAEAEARNAATPYERTAAYRRTVYGPTATAKPVVDPLHHAMGISASPKPAGPVKAPRPAPLAVPRVPGEAITKRPDTKRTPRPRPVPAPPKVHIAPVRITDGLRPNHAARAVPIGDAFPLLRRDVIGEEVAVDVA